MRLLCVRSGYFRGQTCQANPTITSCNNSGTQSNASLLRARSQILRFNRKHIQAPTKEPAAAKTMTWSMWTTAHAKEARSFWELKRAHTLQAGSLLSTTRKRKYCWWRYTKGFCYSLRSHATRSCPDSFATLHLPSSNVWGIPDDYMVITRLLAMSIHTPKELD